MFFPEFRKKTKNSNITTPIQCPIGGSCQHNKGETRRQKREYKDWKGRKREEITLSVFAGNIIVWIETSKKATANLLEFICEFSKAVG